MKNNDNTFIMSPKVDFCFKELLADEDVRRGFVAAVLDIKPDRIKKNRVVADLFYENSIRRIPGDPGCKVAC